MRPDVLITLDRGSDQTLQEQIRRAIARAIACGELSPGSRAPGSRALAARVGVSRNTVLLAYQQLAADGFLTGRERSGLFVSSDGRPAAGDVAGAAAVQAPPLWTPPLRVLAPPAHQAHAHAHARGRTPPDWARYPYAFIDGLIDPAMFPAADWRDALRRALAPRDQAIWAGGLGDADDPLLVEEIALRVLPRRGVHARPDEILITSGARQGLSLAFALFADTRANIVVEAPGEPHVLDLARLARASVRPRPVDPGGLVIDAGEAADVVLVTPGCHYPTGAVMPLRRRESLLQWAGRTGAVVVENDMAGESIGPQVALPALRGLAGGGQVVHVADLAAVLGPALRLGYMVADARIVAAARRLRSLTAEQPPLLSQRAAAHFIGRGGYARLLAFTGRMLERRRGALVEALNHYLQRWVAIDPSAGGSSVWVRGPASLDVAGLARDAEQNGILIEAAPVAGAAEGAFRLGVTGVPLERIRPGVAALAGLIRARLSPSFDAQEIAPALLRGDALRAAMGGAHLLCKTITGAPCAIELRPDGVMIGRAGYANEDRDEGRWWVEGDLWRRQWRTWAYGEASAYRPLIQGDRVQWLDEAGVAVDWAVYVPPGDPPPSAFDLAP
jgi:GntR family transcriptional regulator/MocR family aminotransferase